MAKSDLELAAELISRPDISPEDRDALLREYPSLVPKPVEMQAPSFLSEQPEPDQASSPVPSPDLMEGITEQGPPLISKMEPETLGSNVGIEPGEIQPEEVIQAPLDPSYAMLAEQQHAEELDKMDDGSDNEEVRNATKKYSMYAEPQVNAESFDAKSVYYHFEPTVEEVKRWAARTGNEKAYKDVDDNEEESETYKNYSDIQWKKVRSAFEKTGEGAIRVSYLDPKSAANWYDKIMGPAQGRAISFLGGADDMFSLGIGKQALAYAAGNQTPATAEQELVKAGVIRPFAERLEAQKSRYPIESIAGSIAAFPISAGRAVTEGVAYAAKKTGVKAAQIAAPFIDAAIIGAGLGTTEKVGAGLRGEEAPSWTDVGLGAILQGLFGVAIGYGGGKLAKLGLGKVKSLRADPTMRENLSRLSLGSTKESGGTTMKPFSGGVRPHKQYAKKVDEIAEEQAKAAISGGKQPPSRAPTTEMAEGIEWQMRKHLDQVREKTKSEIHARKKNYFDSTDNLPESQKVSLEPLGKRILEMQEEASPDGWKLPWSNDKISEVVDSMYGDVPHIGPPKLDTEKVGRWTEGKRLGDMIKIDQLALAGDIMNSGGIIRSGDMTKGWRRVTPRQFDDITENLASMLNEEANKVKGKKAPRQLNELQGLLMDLRDRFPANEYAPKSIGASVIIGGKEVPKYGGLSGINAWSHKKLNKIRNYEEAMNLKKIDRLEPDMDAQKIAVMKRIQEWGLQNPKANVSDATLRELFKGRPELVETLDAIASGEAFEAIQRGSKGGSGAAISSGGPRAWATGSVGRIFGTYSDPVYRALSRLDSGKAAAIGGARRREFVPAAEKALLGIKDIASSSVEGVSALMRLWKEAEDRGIADEFRKNKEKQ